MDETTTVRSADGTKIALDEAGVGDPLILIDGAMCTRSFGSKPELVRCLAADFRVYSYDRRGRGESGDTLPYAVEREVEDLEAVVERAGGSAFVYGHSSGACLALESAVALGSEIKKVAMYEAPYKTEPAEKEAWSNYVRSLQAMLAAGNRGDAIALFMEYVGTPADQIKGMRLTPFWSGLEALAPTLAYDHAGLVGADGSIPFDRALQITAPTLVMHGGASYDFMAETATSLSTAIPTAELHTLDLQVHNVEPSALAPVLVEFFRRA